MLLAQMIYRERQNFMKLMLIVLCVLCAATAVGQVGMGAISAQPYIPQIPYHAEHATQHAMATEQPLVGGGAYIVMHGERPLWEFGPVKEEPSLGDVARAYRKQKLTGKKAELVFEKQGS
jgi:hypothetical protein